MSAKPVSIWGPRAQKVSAKIDKVKSNDMYDVDLNQGIGGKTEIITVHISEIILS